MTNEYDSCLDRLFKARRIILEQSLYSEHEVFVCSKLIPCGHDELEFEFVAAFIIVDSVEYDRFLFDVDLKELREGGR